METMLDTLFGWMWMQTNNNIFISVLPWLMLASVGLFAGRKYMKITRIRENLNHLSHKKILAKKNRYYKHLHPVKKKDFANRVSTFISQKKFISRDPKMKVTEEMKVQLAACAVQLTFGLPPVYFPHFHTILIYPRRYFSTVKQRYHTGEINMGGIIVFSWKDFEDGYKDHYDGRNLGLHEMAHALQFENSIENREYDFLSQRYMVMWKDAAEIELILMMRDEGHFLRNYAATNQHEFFAVCVEQFFERPREFRKAMPELFFVMTKLLNQHPLY